MSQVNIAEFPQIGSVNEPRLFTLQEANELFPLVRRITTEAYAELEPIKQRIKNMLLTDPRIKSVEMEYERVVKRWVNKMERLGVVVKGLWLVDFDTGDGFLCWRHPELRLAHYHDYNSGYADRIPLNEVIERYDPDWA